MQTTGTPEAAGTMRTAGPLGARGAGWTKGAAGAAGATRAALQRSLERPQRRPIADRIARWTLGVAECSCRNDLEFDAPVHSQAFLL
jgi:hypothetical protein